MENKTYSMGNPFVNGAYAPGNLKETLAAQLALDYQLRRVRQAEGRNKKGNGLLGKFFGSK